MTAIDQGGARDGRHGAQQKAWFGTLAAIVGCALTVLCLVSITPVLPLADLDSSWRYAVDYAAVHHWPFGTAIVFTFGPLAAVYTDVRVPSHDVVYLVSTTLMAMGLFVGFLLASTPHRRGWLILLPVLVAEMAIKDAAFFVLTLTLVLASRRQQWSGWSWHAAVGLVAVIEGLLLLVKGSILAPVLGCTLLSCVNFLRHRSRWAVLLPAVIVLSAAVTWVAVGQSLADAPAYLRDLSEVAAGYTEAMSIAGDLSGPALFWVVRLLLAGLFGASSRTDRVTTVLAVLGILFVAFKAGFVRQDGHAIIAAATLSFVGLLLILQAPTPSRSAYGGLVLSIAIGLMIARGAGIPIDFGSLVDRFAGKVARSWSGLETRVSQPGQVFAAFDRSKDLIRSQAALPRLVGPTDIYPTDIAKLLASDLDWRPRPVIQSYSAYTPRLADLNARHLESADAPANILFDIAPLDLHYPSLEDGASWPAILSHYDFASFAGPYALLRRTAVDHHATVGGAIVARSYPFGSEVAVPADVPNVWASLRFHPSLLGRLASLVFKRPPLFLSVTFTTGLQKRFRLIAGMADGFLLSPMIPSPRDFLALSAGDRDVLAHETVRSFRVESEGSQALLGARFDVTLAPLTFDRHDVGGQELYGTLVEGPSLKGVPAGGECSIDLVGDEAVEAVPVMADGSSTVIRGWGLIAPSAKVMSDHLEVALTDGAGRTFYSEVQRLSRPDVNQYFSLPEDWSVGYTARVDLRSLPKGRYGLHVVQHGPDGTVACPSRPVTLDH